MLPEELRRARDLLMDVTPLCSDCGLLCGAACCRSHPGEQTGMLLFPGEEALYMDDASFRMLPTKQGTLLICSGHCNRANRPLACRMFPLLILVREDGVKVAMDAAARAVCPLAKQGKQALSQTFVARVREAGRCLVENKRLAAHLALLTSMQDELHAVRRQYIGGSNDV